MPPSDGALVAVRGTSVRALTSRFHSTLGSEFAIINGSLQVRQLGRGALGQAFGQRAETLSSFRRTPATVQPRAIELQFAKGRTKYNRLMPFARPRPSATRTPPLLGGKCGTLLLDEALLQPGQDGSRFGQGQPERFSLQGAALQMSHLLDHFHLPGKTRHLTVELPAGD
jgi:hypothetical protein